jgi:tetratricopeptide (TPR) repeat protein
MRGALFVLAAALTVPVTALAGQAQLPAPAQAPQRAAPLSTRDLGQVYIFYLQGRELAARRDFPGAIASFRKALELAPEAADLRAELAGLHARSNPPQLREARAEARRAIDTDSDNREAHRVLGLIESAMIQQSPTPPTAEMLQEVIGHLEYALAGGVTDPPVQLTVAELYLQQGNATRAAAAAQKFLQDQPGYPRAVLVLVAALDSAGRSDEVGAALADLRGEPADELLAMAQSFFEGGAARHVVTLLEPRVTSPLQEDLESGAFGRMATAVAMAFNQLGEPKRAIAVVEQARERKATGGRLLFTLAAAYERDGQHDNAERTFRVLIADQPADAQALNYLGYMLADRGQKLEEAVDLITRALALDRDNPSYLDSLGWAYYRLRRFEDARAPLERAAGAAPEESVIQDHLGDLYVELKRYSDAAAAFNRALEGNRSDIDVAAITKKRDRARELAAQK